MKIPEGMTEEEVLEIIEQVAKGLAHEFKFGFYELDDMRQEARLESLDALNRYDASRGKLKTFLWTHVRNRLFNLKRNKFARPDMPCLNCPLKAYDPHYERSNNQCAAFNDKMNCDKYHSWERRNTAKKNVVNPIGMSTVRDEHESRMKKEDDVEDKLNTNEMISLIDNNIPISLRSSWIKLRNDVKMNKPEKNKILEAIKIILEGKNYDS